MTMTKFPCDFFKLFSIIPCFGATVRSANACAFLKQNFIELNRTERRLVSLVLNEGFFGGRERVPGPHMRVENILLKHHKSLLRTLLRNFCNILMGCSTNNFKL